MAEAGVESLLEKLKQLLLYHANLITDSKKQVEELEKDLRHLKTFLKNSRQKEDGLRRKILNVVYEAEDIIDGFVSQAAESKSKNIIVRAFKPSLNSHLSEQIEFVGNKLRSIYGNNISGESSLRGRPGSALWRHEIEAPLIREDNLVGFEDDTKIIIQYLTEETQHLDVVSIIGRPGIGKTTFARKIFRDRAIQHEFPTRIWVHISQEFTKKDVLLAVLKKLTELTDDMNRQADEELAQAVAVNLERKKFLIVMDDLRSVGDWDKIRIALPTSNKMGKVLITCCSEEVGWYANKDRPPHKLSFLSKDASWMLLESEVFRGAKCPPELATIGKLIAEQCDGLPLAVVVIGRILARDDSPSADVTTRKGVWREAYQNLSTYLNQRFYDDLPDQLRDCFLYLGVFPEEYKIAVWQLVYLWIAEGFIQQKDGFSLEETAEKYLEELINRNLLKIDKFKSDGKAKTCRIDHTLREFCKIEAGHEKENLFQEIIKSSEGRFEPPLSEMQKLRRLCMHSNFADFISTKPHCPNVRSFLCFAEEDVQLSSENSSAIPEAFNLLRVVDVKPIKLAKIPSDWYQLMHLKYIALSFNLSSLPAAFSKLWNVQTLIVDTTSSTLEIKADIWKLMQLRCLKTNVPATLPKPSRTSSSDGEKLQTLGTISHESCTKDVLERTCNLKKLAIRGKLALLLDGSTGSFDSFAKLSNLEKLKLLNDASSPTESGLPPAYKFPPKLKYLTLSGTRLNWRHMLILSKLLSLKVLKLKGEAFMGETWAASDHGIFHSLEVLQIGRTNLVSWEASGDNFPKLRCLLLRNCEKLQEIPFGLATVQTLQLLELYCTKLAAASARNISEMIQMSVAQEYIKDFGFKLSIIDE